MIGCDGRVQNDLNCVGWAYLNSTNSPLYNGVNGSVTLGDGLTQRGRYPGDGSHPVESRGEDPIGGLADEPIS